MVYKVEWTRDAKKSWEKLDKVMARKIKDKIDNELAKDLYGEGEELRGDLKGQWSFHFSGYRVIYEIFQSKLIIKILEVGSRQGKFYERVKRKYGR